MAKKFAIVKYTDEDNSIGIIPLNWIFSNESSCLYPPALTSDTTRDKLVMTETEPIVGKWIVCNIKILHKYEAYSTARSSLKIAEETSNLDTDDDLWEGRKRRKKDWGKDFLFSEYSSDDESGTVQQKQTFNDKIPTYPSLGSFKSAKTKKNINSLSSNTTNATNSLSISSQGSETPRSCSTCDDNRFVATSFKDSCSPLTSRESQNLLQNIDSAGGTRICSTPSSIRSGSSAFSDSDRTLLGQIQATLGAVAEKLDILHHNVNILMANQESGTIAEPSCNDRLLGLLPLENLEDFNALEEKTKENTNFANQLVKIFASIGGKDVRSCVMDIMKRLMADMLAEEFSYSGKVTTNDNPKIAFCKKNICHIIHVAARKIFKDDAKDDKIRSAICCWLQQAKARRSRRHQRRQTKARDV